MVTWTSSFGISTGDQFTNPTRLRCQSGFVCKCGAILDGPAVLKNTPLFCLFVLFCGDKVDEAAKRGTCVSNPASVLHKFLSHLLNTFSELEMD